jgi:hypothetical protein
MKHRWALALLVVSSLSLSGCPLLLIGAGAAGGYAVGRDSVRNQFEISKDHLYQQSLSASKELGFILSDDAAGGVIKLKIQNTTVTITVKPVTQRAVELRVKARNNLLMPEVDVAQQVYNTIIKRL